MILAQAKVLIDTAEALNSHPMYVPGWTVEEDLNIGPWYIGDAPGDPAELGTPDYMQGMLSLSPPELYSGERLLYWVTLRPGSTHKTVQVTVGSALRPQELGSHTQLLDTELAVHTAVEIEQCKLPEQATHHAMRLILMSIADDATERAAARERA